MTRMIKSAVSAVLLSSLAAVAGPLQDLINQAAPGATVTVPAGTYNEAITLKDGIALISEQGPEATIIDAQGGPFGVVGAPQAVLIGFTVRNAQTAIYNLGNFIGVFECIVTDYHQQGVHIEKGAAAVVNNLISGTKTATGVLCTEANPYVGYNVIANNQTGFSVSRWLIPTLDHNVFLSNDVGIASADGTCVVLQGNVFDGNGQNAVGLTLGTNDEVRAATAAELTLRRGLTVESYRTLMKKVFEEAVALQPRIMYDLTETIGQFNLIVTYPYATFSVSASAKDTVIKAYDAYDRQTDASLNAQYVLAHGGYPTVAVINPQITDKAFDRYVLEKLFVHPASYSEGPDGRRTFSRLTNLPRIEVILPVGWTMVEGNAGATVEPRGNRQVIKLSAMGMTQLHFVLAHQP